MCCDSACDSGNTICNTNNLYMASAIATSTHFNTKPAF
jgi:hypothetical protein